MTLKIKFTDGNTLTISNAKRYSTEVSRHDDDTVDIRVTIIAGEIYHIPMDNIVYITAEGNCNG